MVLHDASLIEPMRLWERQLAIGKWTSQLPNMTHDRRTSWYSDVGYVLHPADVKAPAWSCAFWITSFYTSPSSISTSSWANRNGHHWWCFYEYHFYHFQIRIHTDYTPSLSHVKTSTIIINMVITSVPSLGWLTLVCFAGVTAFYLWDWFHSLRALTSNDYVITLLFLSSQDNVNHERSFFGNSRK